MADYIKKNILCQAYIHAESAELSDAQLLKIQNELNDFVTKRAQFFLYKEVEVDVELGEGSLKSWASILGTLSALYAGIANYPSFREGVVAIHDDVSRLSSSIVSESLFVTKTKNIDVIRIESRTGIIGSLKRILDQLMFIRENNGSISAERMQKAITQTSIDIERLLSAIKNEADLELIKKHLLDEAKKTPARPIPGQKERSGSAQIVLYTNRRKSIFDMLKDKSV
ncbi:MAG: hypothetical protein ACYC0O_06605 [Desulfurivibrionaceae bacterium]